MQIEIIPCLRDNYAYLIHDPQTKTTAVIDPSEVPPILKALKLHQWNLSYICNTHHHWDHVNGNLELKAKTGAQVIGFKGDQARIPNIDITVEASQRIEFGALMCDILFIPGHTLGHIAYYFPEHNAAFVGDTLFSLGCGRLFEGTAEQMWQSLEQICHLPEETRLYCGHEYTLANARFALSLDPRNLKLLDYVTVCERLRSDDKPTLPTTVWLEKRLNPFLRVVDPLFLKQINTPDFNPSEAFKILRQQKDHF